MHDRATMLVRDVEKLRDLIRYAASHSGIDNQEMVLDLMQRVYDSAREQAAVVMFREAAQPARSSMDEQTQAQCKDQLRQMHDATWLWQFIKQHRVSIYPCHDEVRVFCKYGLEMLAESGPTYEDAVWRLAERVRKTERMAA